MLVTVVIAAYNSSSRLMCAVESVRGQDMQDFEIVVVGDAVTDDSGVRLASLDDDRIRWENMPTNWGEQSVPSNRGIELARGRYVFFLNQDDLWHPNHLSSLLALLDNEEVDVVWSPYLIIPPRFHPNSESTAGLRVMGVSPEHPRFDAITFIPASCTGWRGSALDLVQGWRTAGEVTVSPSQDLLWRAARAGLNVVGTDRPSVLVLWSGSRNGSYLPSYRPEDNEAWLDALTETPWLVDQEIARASVVEIALLTRRSPWRRLHRWSARKILNWFCGILGIHPTAPFIVLKYSKSGGFINTVRARNDLERRNFKSSPNGKSP